MATDFAQQQWTRELFSILKPRVVEVILSIYDAASALCEKENKRTMTLLSFQNLLSKVPDWPEDKVNEECDRIRRLSGQSAEYVEDIVNACFVSFIRAMTASREGRPKRQVDLELPTFESFVHRVYHFVARALWPQAKLFEGYKGATSLQKQEVQNKLEAMVESAITDSIRTSVNLSKILPQLFEDSETPVAAPAPTSAPTPAPAPVPATAPVPAPVAGAGAPLEASPEFKVIDLLDLEVEPAPDCTDDDDDDDDTARTVDSPLSVEFLDNATDGVVRVFG
jgi:hypothetical protein